MEGSDGGTEHKRRITSRWARGLYLVILAVGFFLAIMAKQGLFSFVDDIPLIQTCDGDKCTGVLMVYRVSFSLLFLFGMQTLLLTCGTDDMKQSLHTGHWFKKLWILFIVLVVSFFIPNSFFVGYAYACLFLAGIFVFLQILILLEFAYAWNEGWTEKEWYIPILACAFFLFAGGIAAIAMCYKWFTVADTCALNKFLISWTLIIGVLYTILSLVMSRGVLPPSVVFAFSVYWTWSALFSEPSSEECNSLAQDTTGEKWQLAIAALIGAGSLVYTTLQTTESTDAFTLSPATRGGEADDAEEGSERFWVFHLIMVLAAAYMSAIVTAWQIRDTDDVSSLDQGWASTWIKIATVWLASLFFSWTLIAPAVCKNRDFD